MVGTLHKANRCGVTPSQRIRATQQSHILYDKITQLINTGELSEDILDKQVLITAVRMHANLDFVHVYWDCNRSDAEEVEELLRNHEKKLRSLLISYHTLGRIPPVTFVKDGKVGDLSTLLQLMEVADYGPDYMPSAAEDKLASTPGLSSSMQRWSLPQDFSQQFDKTNTSSSRKEPLDSLSKSLDSDAGLSSKDIETETSTTNTTQATTQFAAADYNFRSDLYGLPRDDLLRKVMAQKTKVKPYGSADSQLCTDAQHQTNFDMKQLNFHKMKNTFKLKVMKSSSKVKQRLLERVYDDVEEKNREAAEERSRYREEIDDEYYFQSEEDGSKRRK